MSKVYKLFVLMLLFASTLLAQNYTISGTVTSSQTGENLVGANVYLKNTTMGAATDVDGNYSIEVKAGRYTVICSYIGFETKQEIVTVSNNVQLNFSLSDFAFSMSVEVVADRARDFETPVAFTTVDKAEIEEKLGSRDIPLVLNTAPSTYATSGGGGSGDGRVNVRGFDQRNVAVMINGVPVNDIEWGWVYWSNWDGIGDAAGSIQLQRGLSATTLNTPSIGGSLNLISEPTAQKFGVSLRQEFGSGAFLKTALSFASGLQDDKWAINGTVVRKTGDGIADATWTDAWSYYLGAAYNINKNNRIELYALGAPQRHGQRSWRLNIATFSHKYARDLDDTEAGWLDDPQYAEQGLKYNSNWNNVSSSYTGKQYWNGSEGDRFDPNFMNERENYYHKPQVNLNWYSKFSDMLSLYTTVYYSGGRGGGSGTFGSLNYDFTLKQRVVDWDSTIEENQNASGGTGIITDRRNDPDYDRSGILRNSVNSQDQWGAVAKLAIRANDNLNLQVGVDWRTAKVFHYREVRDLLGATAFHWNGNEFESGNQYFKRLGDKIDYDFTNTVDWIGGFVQGEYTTDKVTAFGIVGMNTKSYGYTNHMVAGADGNELTAETDAFTGYQFKGGASYRFDKSWMGFVNAGYVSSAPIFDNTINDRTGFVVVDPDNEKFISGEVGLQYMSSKFSANVGFYYTQWQDRATTVAYSVDQDTEGMILISGMDQLHTGIEVDLTWQPINELKIDGVVGLGNWKFTDNVSATYKDYSGGGEQDEEFNAYVKDLKVGDSPQTSLALTATVYPVNGLSIAVTGFYYADHYSAWDPFDRTDETDTAQPWLIPSYSIVDLHANYLLPVKLGPLGIEVFAHVFNVLDEEYVSDATDNSAFNGYGEANHKADDAEVYFGLPRYFNFGLRLML